LIRKDFEVVFEKCDVVAGPVSPTVAFHLGDNLQDPLKMYLADIYTLSANLSGLPAISFNAGFLNHLPVGLQLMAPWWDELTLLKMANFYEQLAPHSKNLPNKTVEEWQ
jgi:aspartyl-tRNA(Asn)/glutamyl-tRNA(Gln) amidotransferase subunit A